jgi:hypothetical protein
MSTDCPEPDSMSIEQATVSNMCEIATTLEVPVSELLEECGSKKRENCAAIYSLSDRNMPVSILNNWAVWRHDLR